MDEDHLWFRRHYSDQNLGYSRLCRHNEALIRQKHYNLGVREERKDQQPEKFTGESAHP